MIWRGAIAALGALALAGCGDLANRLDSAADGLDAAADQVQGESEILADEGRVAIAEASPGAPVSLALAPVSAIEVIDGDTVRFEGIRYRLRSADAPETREPACAAEAAAGEASTAWVRARLAAAAEVEARGFGPHWVLDRYRRRLAYVLVDGEDLGAALIASGHGAPRGRGHWCTPA